MAARIRYSINAAKKVSEPKAFLVATAEGAEDDICLLGKAWLRWSWG